MKKIFNLALMALVVMMATSCSSKRAAMDSGVGRRAIQEQYGECIQNAFDYDWLQVKGKISFKGKPALPVRLSMRQNENFNLQVNAPLLGFELGRMEVDRDSITLVHKMDKLYTRQSIGEFSFLTEYGLDVRTLQCVFLGRMCLPKHGECKVRDFSKFAWSKADDGSIVGIHEGEMYTLAFTINVRGQVSQAHLIVPSKNVDVVWDYTEWYNLGVGYAPSKSHLTVTTDKVVEANVNFSQPNIEAGPWQSFEPTAKYKVLDPYELMDKMIHIKTE